MDALTEQMMTPEEVAELMRVRAATVRGWLRLGRLPGSKLPGGSRVRWRIRRDDFAKFLAERESAGSASS